MDIAIMAAALATLAVVIATVIVNRRTMKTMDELVARLEERRNWSLGEDYEKSVRRHEIPHRGRNLGVTTDLYPKEDE